MVITGRRPQEDAQEALSQIPGAAAYVRGDVAQAADRAGFVDGAMKAFGRIVNITSVSASVVSVNRGDYCMSKAALSMATQVMAARLGEFGIDCFEVRPGLILTDMTAGVKAKYDALIASGILVQSRWGTPADVASAVSCLVRGDLAYAPGQVISIDGGLTIVRL